MEAKHMEISCDSVMPPKHPWFVSQKVEDEGDNTQFHIFYNIHDPMSHYRCQIPELLGKRIRGCFHGCWVVLSSNHPRDVIWSLWNPITSKIINLPPLKYSKSKGCCDDMRECCLSAPPEDPNSVLLLMRTTKPNFVYCRLGMDSSFRKKLESDKIDDDESHLFNLPPHVLETLLMEFCAGVDYLKFRATCKHCHLAAPLIPWNNGKASKIMQKYSVPSPWLIVFHKHEG
ncbi:hypothetical protein Tco_0211340, partial [Tanacetum coccineum]